MLAICSDLSVEEGRGCRRRHAQPLVVITTIPDASDSQLFITQGVLAGGSNTLRPTEILQQLHSGGTVQRTYKSYDYSNHSSYKSVYNNVSIAR